MGINIINTSGYGSYLFTYTANIYLQDPDYIGIYCTYQGNTYGITSGGTQTGQSTWLNISGNFLIYINDVSQILFYTSASSNHIWSNSLNPTPSPDTYSSFMGSVIRLS